MNKLDLLHLHSIPGIGTKTLHKILEWSAQHSLSEFFELETSELARLFNLNDTTIATLQGITQQDAENTLRELEKDGWQILIQSEAAYPRLLIDRLETQAPPILYVKGNPEVLRKPGLAFSGSRHTSETGLKHTEMLVKQAVQRTYTIISGHAPGVDAKAHQTAVEQGGITIIVPPEGALKFALRASLRDYQDQIVIVSEFPPQMSWSTGNAMARNRVIVGLAQALVVIEAGDTGGTISAGRSALKRDIPLYVLHSSDAPESAAGNAILIEEGGIPLSSEPSPKLPDLGGKKDEHPPQFSQPRLF